MKLFGKHKNFNFCIKYWQLSEAAVWKHSNPPCWRPASISVGKAVVSYAELALLSTPGCVLSAHTANSVWRVTQLRSFCLVWLWLQISFLLTSCRDVDAVCVLFFHFHPVVSIPPDRTTWAMWRSWLWWSQLSAMTWTTGESTTPTYRGESMNHLNVWLYMHVWEWAVSTLCVSYFLCVRVCVCVSRSDHPLAQLYCHSTMEHHHFDHCLMILNSPVGGHILHTKETFLSTHHSLGLFLLPFLYLPTTKVEEVVLNGLVTSILVSTNCCE